MKKLTLLTGLFCILIACQNNNNSVCTFSGSLDNIEDGSILQLVDIDKGSVYKEIVVQNGKFKMELNLTEPKFIGIWCDKPKYAKYRRMLWLENSSITLKGKIENISNAKITGSESNKIFERYSTLDKKYVSKLEILKKDKTLTAEKSTPAREKLQNQYKRDLITFYSTFRGSYVALYLLSVEIIKYETVISKSDIAQLFDKLPDNFRNSEKGNLIKEFISLPTPPKIGEKFIDFVLPTPDGKLDSISGHLGKFTLLEFWASSCSPCRYEHPTLRKFYNKYHSKGLNIIGISGDTDMSDWENAIKKDTIPWTNISDLRGWNNKAFMIYGIKELPNLVLLDEHGIIIDNTLNRKYLPRELEKLLNK